MAKFSRAPGVHQAICLWQGRSGKWPRVRKQHLKAFPFCACCGGKKKLEVHHVIPYSLDRKLELDPSNLVTLCDHMRCHLLIGHLGRWASWNVLVCQMAATILKAVTNRPEPKKRGSGT